MTRLLLALLGFIAALPEASPANPSPRPALPPPLARQVDYDRDIRPIFARACFSCHGPDKQRAGLRLDHAAGLAQGGNSGPSIKPRDSAASLLVQLVAGLEPDRRMPPGKGKELAPSEVSLLRAWIDQGARYPASTAATTSAVRSSHWAFQPIRRPPIPRVSDPAWIRQPFDAFVLQRLETARIRPNPEADRLTLLRRLHLDLLGLPPSPEEIDSYLADTRPGAYERAVDRLLASPHYGERWGRHWLDAARYADSDGYEKDTGRPYAWRYRQWVLDALNRDLPFDQFTLDQLAGDLLPGSTPEQKAATGFHRNTLTNREGGVDAEQFRVEAVVDRVNTTARVWLGLTMGCAQCHDHKYDPLSQRDYYRFFAFFNSDVERDLPAPHPVWVTSAPPAKKPTPGKTHTLAPTLSLGKPRRTHVMIRGDFLRPGVEVQPGTPESLEPLSGPPPANRLDLARWLMAPRNPLTARVTVNWVWHRYFGRGLVPTLEDFGTQGEKPTHPELLDWLAWEFMSRGWSFKDLHRLILTSATYRQSSQVRPDILAQDPYNALLSRQVRLRLDAEILRDNLLTTSGLLVRTLGGPSVRPPQPRGISDLTYAGSARWVESTGSDRYRRGLYTWFQRTSPYPMLLTFDAPDANLCAVKRERSNTPLQALTLLNDAVFLEGAQALARRVMTQAEGTPEARLVYAFRICTARRPTTDELASLRSLHDDLLALSKTNPKEARALAGGSLPGCSDTELAAWVGLARTLLNLDEVMTRE
ncbi:MAG: PSD1 and planctomycete cytochrome C domain-containing protein [Gemmataceae bacterium]